MKTLMYVALILTTLASVAIGQEKTSVDRVGEKIAGEFESRLPGWRYKRVEPSSSTIVVQFWTTPNRIVKVAVAIRESVEDAKKEIKSFLEFRRAPEQLNGYGDEAYAPERDGGDVVLRKGRYVIYISIVAHVESDPDAQDLSSVEIEARRKSEVHRIGKEFARQLSSIELE